MMTWTDRPNRDHRGLAVLTALAALLCAPAAAFGDPPSAETTEAKTKAEAKVAEGAKLFEQGRFADAIERYKAAEGLYPSAKIAYNLGLAYLGMGKRALAAFQFERFIRDARDAAPDYLVGARAELQRLKEKLAFLEISCDTEGAAVSIDGSSFGLTPLAAPVPVEPGRHELVVRDETWGSRSRAVSASAKQRIKLRVEFRADTAKAPGPVGNKQRPHAPILSPARVEEVAPGQGRGSEAGPSQAEALIRQAIELRRASRDEAAYPLLQKAHDLERTPRTAAQLGLVEMQLGYWLAAEEHLNEALASGRDPWIAKNRASLETSLAAARSAIGEIVVTGTPMGASVLVNGKPAGSLPYISVRSGEGTVTLEVRAPGHASVVRTFTVSGGHREEFPVALATESASGATVRESAASQPTAPSTSATPQQDQLDAPSRSTRLARPLAWSAAGLGAGALGLGVYLTTRWIGKLDEFDNHRSMSAPGQAAYKDCGVGEPGRGGLGCKQIYSDAQRAKWFAMGAYALGGLLAAGSITLFVLSAERDRGESAISCVPSVVLRGGSCSLVF